MSAINSDAFVENFGVDALIKLDNSRPNRPGNIRQAHFVLTTDYISRCLPRFTKKIVNIGDSDNILATQNSNLATRNSTFSKSPLA